MTPRNTLAVFMTALAVVTFSTSPATAYSTGALQRAALVVEPGEEICNLAVSEARDDFALYVSHDQAGKPSGELPADVAAVHFRSMYNSCYELPSAEEILDAVFEVNANDLPTCTGAGSTIMGWQDAIVLLGTPYPVTRGPASSDYTIAYDPSNNNAIVAADGYSRSALDDIAWVNEELDPDAQVVYWSFAGIPMGGMASLGPGQCLLGVLLNINSGASGVPLGIPVIGNVLQVSAGGTTCLVPC